MITAQTEGVLNGQNLARASSQAQQTPLALIWRCHKQQLAYTTNSIEIELTNYLICSNPYQR